MTFTRINVANKILKFIDMEYFVFFQGKMIPISGKNKLANFVEITYHYEMITENQMLTKFTLMNNGNIYFPIKLFVKCSLHPFEKNYVFVSPKEDVLFLSNRHGLFLTSGIINYSSISQYGVFKREDYSDKIRQGRIPLYPLGTGDVVGIFSLETTLKPYGKTIGYTWTMLSEAHEERNLIKWDRRLKSRLAFSKK